MWNHSDWRRLQKIAPSSRKSFILPILVLLLLLFLYTQNECILALFIMVASTWILLPTFIDALNRYWHMFGLFLSWLLQPIFLSVVYLLIVCPMALIRSFFHKNNQEGHWVTKKKKCNFQKAF